MIKSRFKVKLRIFIFYTLGSNGLKAIYRLYSKRAAYTFLNVLILVERFQGVVLSEAAESVDQVGAQVGVDVLRGELGVALPVHSPVGVVAHHLFVVGEACLPPRPHLGA